MFNAIKGLLFEEDPNAPKDAGVQPKGTVQPAQSTTAPRQPIPGGATYVAPTTQVTGFVEAIRKATFGRTTALTNLIAQADNFVGIIPDEKMRLQAAHKASGARSAKEISDAVAIHLQDVDSEAMRFSQAMGGKKQAELGGLQSQVNAKEGAITGAQREIEAASQRIAQLQQGIADNTVALSQLRSDLQQKEVDFQHADEDFKTAAQIVRDELNAHKMTITSTIGG